MAIGTCRECGSEASDQAFACPRCGAPYPTSSRWNGTGFEWKSKASFWGMPLVHIAFGRDREQKRRVAKGVIAVGQYAVGAVAVGQFAAGVVCVAQFGAGLLGICQFAFALACLSQFGVAALFGFGQFIYTLR